MGALACTLALLLSGTGVGTKYMETTIQDDAVFLHRPAAQVYQAADQVASLGATRIRLTASWSNIAPAAGSRRVPGTPFDASSSGTYPGGSWTALDTAVKAAAHAGLKVMIDLAFWAPRWAVQRPSANPLRERYAPDPGAFADFATAAARRYSGAFPDPVDPRRDLPAVRLWTTWNEPNHPSFLQPQWRPDGAGGWRPESPHVYRALHNAAYAAIKRVSWADRVLIGGTASTGSSVPGKGGVPPLEFVRALACVDDNLRPLRIPECRHFTPIKADGWAHHPYSRFVTPGTSDPATNDAPIADVGRLDNLLAILHARGRFEAPLPVYDTEYGYESKEDDPYSPFTRLQQAQFMGWSTYLAWRDPNTVMFGQFLLRDINPNESGRNAQSRSFYRDWQTGLFTWDGQPKPAAQAFKLPFWAQTEGAGNQRAILLFGQVRPGHGPRTVRVERKDPQTGAWASIQTVGPACDAQDDAFLTDHAGFFLRTAPALGAASYRFSWRHDDGTWESSIAVPVAADASQPPPV